MLGCKSVLRFSLISIAFNLEGLHFDLHTDNDCPKARFDLLTHGVQELPTAASISGVYCAAVDSQLPRQYCQRV